MKKCRFCDHRRRTDNGEDVCTKYLLRIGEETYDSCENFEIDFCAKPIAAWLLTILVMFMIIALC